MFLEEESNKKFYIKYYNGIFQKNVLYAKKKYRNIEGLKDDMVYFLIEKFKGNKIRINDDDYNLDLFTIHEYDIENKKFI